MLRNIFKTFLITLILLNLAIANSDKNTILNIKVKIDDKFRTSLNLDPNLYKIWIGTSDGRNQFSEPVEAPTKKTYIPGLPGSAPLVEEVYTSGAVSESFNYMIDIYIDDSYNEEWLTNQMRYSIIEVWPAFGVGDRKNKKINIISMPFQSPSGSTEQTNELKKLEENQRSLENALAKLENDYIQKVNELEEKNSSIDELTKKIEAEKEIKKSTILEEENDKLRFEKEELEDANIAQENKIEALLKSFEQEAKELQLAQMQKQAEEIENLKASVSNSELALDENIQWRLQYLEGQFTKTQRFKDSLLNRMGSQLDKINFPTKEPDNIMSSDSLSQNNSSSHSSGWVMWLAIGLLGLLIILSLVAILTNKKKVIYLKPKEQKSKESDKNSSDQQVQEAPQNNVPQPVAPANNISPTHAPIDEGVMQSEIRTQRQSAVAMSAGQKEGATQIVKDWLEESKNEENSEE